MTKTKRTFLYAGSILGILSAVFMLLIGCVFFICAPVMTKDIVIDSYYEDVNYTAYDANDVPTENKEDIVYFQENTSGEKITVKDINALVKILKTVVLFLAFILVGLGVAEMAFSIIVINVAAKGSKRLAAIVTLLILGAVTCNFLTMAFMIVGLCLKNKPDIEIAPSVENN